MKRIDSTLGPGGAEATDRGAGGRDACRLSTATN